MALPTAPSPDARTDWPGAGPFQPASEPNSNATRHLSAGAYVDPDFSLSALREIYYQPKRVIAPAYGHDSITVLGHCLRARRAMVARDLALVGALLVESWLSLPATLLTLVTLLAVQLTRVAARVVRDAVAYVVDGEYFRDQPTAERVARGGVAGIRRRRRNPADSRPPRRFMRLWLENVVAQIVARSLGLTLVYLLLVAVAVFLAGWVWRTEPLGRTRLGVSPWTAALGFVLLVLLIPALVRAWSRIQLYALLPDRVPTRPLSTRRLAELDYQLHGNTVVYSGFQPFVGSGDTIRSWVLAQRLVRAAKPVSELVQALTEKDREFPVPPFTAQQLSDHVRRYLAELTEDPIIERRLAGLTVGDRVFVAGTETSHLWPYAPESMVARIITDPTAPARHYLQCQVVSWRGELVTTVYVHFAVQGRALYVELKVLALAPCDERYRIVDQVGGTSLRRLLGDAASGALAAPVHLAIAPRGLARAAAEIARLAFAGPSDGRVKKGYDYGAKVSLREMGAMETAPDPMQTQDVVKYGRMVERRVLAAVLDFLEDRGVDVAEYRQHSLMIMAGAFATHGGTVNVGGAAVGFQQNGPATGVND